MVRLSERAKNQLIITRYQMNCISQMTSCCLSLATSYNGVVAWTANHTTRHVEKLALNTQQGKIRAIMSLFKAVLASPLLVYAMLAASGRWLGFQAWAHFNSGNVPQTEPPPAPLPQPERAGGAGGGNPAILATVAELRAMFPAITDAEEALLSEFIACSAKAHSGTLELRPEVEDFINKRLNLLIRGREFAVDEVIRKHLEPYEQSASTAVFEAEAAQAPNEAQSSSDEGAAAASTAVCEPEAAGAADEAQSSSERLYEAAAAATAEVARRKASGQRKRRGRVLASIRAQARGNGGDPTAALAAVREGWAPRQPRAATPRPES